MLSDQTNNLPHLFEAYPTLHKAIPWTPIGRWPTPITQSLRFAEQHGLRQLFIKREDLSHGECGGNKVRSLEFLLAAAKWRGAKTVLTYGVTGSHHISRTAWHAATMGMHTIAFVVNQPHASYIEHNMEIARRVGADYRRTSIVTVIPRTAWCYLRYRMSPDRPFYFIPTGGTSRLSCIGHVNAGLELAAQIQRGELPKPDYLYVALGSLGTAAGLLVGLRLAGIDTHLVGVVTSHRWYATAGRWLRMARRVLALMRRHDRSIPTVRFDPRSISVVTTALGKGYAYKTEDSVRLAQSFEALEGIPLDTTYTAKTLHGMMQTIAARNLHDAVHLFWNTYHRIDV